MLRCCTPLPGWARDYYALGRIAIKVSGATVVVSLGGGGIAAREAEAGLKEGAAWTVFAVGRGQQESHPSLCDFAVAQQPGVSAPTLTDGDEPTAGGVMPGLVLIRGGGPAEAQAFSSLS